MNEGWLRNGPSALHGGIDGNFPNLLLTGPLQAGLSDPSDTESTSAESKQHILIEKRRSARMIGHLLLLFWPELLMTGEHR